ncbi:MAG: hypothetical protein UV61_C0002G0122 [Candidatus Gottesmanbacteria bacterium GW2011_GWB1_43_11]|uniref:Membrane protein 6-pyruvoyl-tetrahydropterin synthase-related domain-containing protein n=1 Tax=Candidatus Gottesmanbacteria bacterium GW2011_GWB1_43_11 TaxID=1618446 RepID=A0A0G1EWK3_9BACT|nr:MAG: hypothetical protein UV04_C0001G0010 [Candidatus Gottesmanbacteria bacterium GW2011_GWA2_42_16]KKS56198.1 MAG: hypothetical protein UV17_C0001G0008 [Candidatus Gottesmanbacteria bacterium GW2011_GWA1_42_26]KKS81794.1 MAG: hypothetical protein UV55_C0008G0009 [Candidatus Gottesmanbacteria bacterium GW2011_GWC1_43_10]KKS87401.1 MAG: hypothetical protein UV61_C0002G0122 [Candidatus Gottesmanbacteria bacterium GW2011_GWB1_43_11]OGG10224.1 MAG: hypothetical protein A2699_01595 [Candidatus Go
MKLSRLFSWLFILLISLPVIYQFLLPGYFPTHDGEWAVVRLAEMHREIKELQLPPRWAGYLNHGFGYPLFLFTYPLPYYLAEILYAVGFGLVSAVKLTFILTVVGSGVTMFLLAESQWGVWGGLVAAALYTYAPYRFTNLFVRGSIGESLALVFFPLLFWLFDQLIQKPSSKLMIAGSLTLAALILTHNALAILFLPFFCVWLVFLLVQVKFSPEKVKILAVTLGLGLLLSAYFWLPAILEKSQIILSQTPLANKAEHFMTLPELLVDSWQFGVRPPLFIGTGLLLAAILSLGSFFFGKPALKSRLLVLVGLDILALIMLFPISGFLWQLPFLQEIDFPWRTLSVATFLLAFTSGAIAHLRLGKVWVVLVIILGIGLNSNLIRTLPRIYPSDDYYQTNDATTTSADELMPIGVRVKPRNRPPEKVVLDSGGSFRIEKNTSTSLKLQVNTPLPTKLLVNTVYFPGWVAQVDQKPSQIEVIPQTGLMALNVPEGAHEVKVDFTNTPIRQVADILSVSGVIVLIYLWNLRKKSFR